MGSAGDAGGAPALFRPLDGLNRGALLTSLHEFFDDCAAEFGCPDAVRGFDAHGREAPRRTLSLRKGQIWSLWEPAVALNRLGRS